MSTKTQTTVSELVSYGGSSFAVVSSLTLTDIGIIVGILTAIATFAVNLFFAYRKDRRERRETAARLRALGEQGDE